MIHRQKKNFPIFLDELIQGAFRHASILEVATSGYQKLRVKRLPLSGDRQNSYDRLIKQLRTKEIGAKSIEIIVDELKGGGASTYWDLYRSMLVAAGRTNLSDRVLRFIAYKLLTGSVEKA
jgi:hypothetical protein